MLSPLGRPDLAPPGGRDRCVDETALRVL